VVLVTHEHDVAAWAARRIVFRDGLVVEDVRQPPHPAAAAPAPLGEPAA
jgi:putative ABC transport system ATP-binding protein